MRKKISVENLKIGISFTHPLFTEDNNIVIKAKEPIKESDYNRLIRWGIKELFTDGEEIKQDNSEEEIKLLEDNQVEQKKIYINIIKLYKDFITSLINNEKNDKQTLKFITEKVIKLATDYKNEIISYMALVTDNYDYIASHSINTAIISIIGAIEYGLPKETTEKLAIAALLHDIGMFKIPDTIINKRGKLTEEEYSIIKSHPIVAFKILKNCNIDDEEILNAVLHHHEQYNGEGYPRKLTKDKISLLARFIAISDAFEAQISFRAYRKSKTGYLAMKNVIAEANNRFDPDVLKAFLNAFSIYPPGSIVQLSDNSIGTVISTNQNAPLRPKVKLLFDNNSEKIKKNVVKDLKSQENLFITKVFDRDEYLTSFD